MKKLYLCQVNISDNEPTFDFMVEAKNEKEGREKASKIAFEDYPNYPLMNDCYLEDMYISEIKTLEEVKKILLVK